MKLEEDFKDYTLFTLEAQDLDPFLIQEFMGLMAKEYAKKGDFYKIGKRQGYYREGFIIFEVEKMDFFLDLLEKKIELITSHYHDLSISMKLHVNKKKKIFIEVLPETMKKLIKLNIHFCFSIY